MNKIFRFYMGLCTFIGFFATPVLIVGVTGQGIKYLKSGSLEDFETGINAPISFDPDRTLFGESAIQTWVAGTKGDRWDWVDIGDPAIAGADLHIGVNTFEVRHHLTRPTSVVISKMEILKDLEIEFAETKKANAIRDREYEFAPFFIHGRSTSKQCIGFQSIDDNAGNQIRGWYCDHAGRKARPKFLSCVLESIIVQPSEARVVRTKSPYCATAKIEPEDPTAVSSFDAS